MASGNEWLNLLIYYKCCEVLSRNKMEVPCWMCGEISGVDYYETYAGARINEMPYRTGTSTTAVMFSGKNTEANSWSHP